MNHQVGWTLPILEKFIKFGNLTDEQRTIMRLRTSDHTDIEIADEIGCSVATYYRKVKSLKKIYDNLVKMHPELNMPTRTELSPKMFDFYNKESAMDFINHINFEREKIEIKIVRKVEK